MTLPVTPPVAPMLARLTRELPLDGYLYEPKWDGFRWRGSSRCGIPSWSWRDEAERPARQGLCRLAPERPRTSDGRAVLAAGLPWPVAAPARWDEVEQAVAEERPELLTFTPGAALDRIERDGDLFAALA